MPDTLLWVDDEPDTLAEICQKLRDDHNLEIDVAGTIETALKNLQSKTYNFLVIDIGINLSEGVEYPVSFSELIDNPVYAGVALLRYIWKHSSELGDPMVLVCSGHSQEFIEELLPEPIPIDYISKSFAYFNPDSMAHHLGLNTSSHQADSKGLNTAETKKGVLSDEAVHDLKSRLLHISRTASIIVRSAPRSEVAENRSHPTAQERKFSKLISSEIEEIVANLDGIDVYKSNEHAEFVDCVQDFADSTISISDERGLPNYSMISEAARKALRATERYGVDVEPRVVMRLERIVHWCNYSAVESFIDQVQSCVEMLGEPTRAESESVKLSRIIEIEANGLQRVASSRNLEIRLKLNSPETMSQEKISKFRSAFHNILSNAIKYNGETGTTRTWVTVRLYDINESVCAEVESWGDAIPSNEKGNLVDTGYRASNASAPGYGLGLSIASQKAHLLGGSVEIDTRPASRNNKKEVTTVRMLLPRDLG